MQRILLLLMTLSTLPMLAQDGLEFSLSGGPGRSYLIMNDDTSKTAANLQLSVQVGFLLNDKVELFTGVQYWQSGFATSLTDQGGNLVATADYVTYGLPVGVRYYLTNNLYGAIRLVPAIQAFAGDDNTSDPVFAFEFTEGSMRSFHLFGEVNLGYAIHLSDAFDIDLEPRLGHSFTTVLDAEGINGRLFEYGINIRLQYRIW